jgi:hypothetical protein
VNPSMVLLVLLAAEPELPPLKHQTEDERS